MDIDVLRARAETPGCGEVTHFNNAGAALMPRCVVEAQTHHLEQEARLGGYEAAAKAAPEAARTYDALAELLNARTEEIALADSATRAWQTVLHALPWQAGDRILTGEAEYASNYIAFLQLARRLGVEIVTVPSDASGQIDVARLEHLIDDRARLIAVTHVPTNGGLVNPAAEIGRVARAMGVPYLLDACQSAGQIALDVAEIGCDFLTACGRKYLRGPRGTGLLFVRGDWLDRLEPASLDLHGAAWTAADAYVSRPDARRFETFEVNYAAVVGLGTAVDYALSLGLPAIEARVEWLAQTLRRRLARLPGVQVHDLGERQCGLVSFTVAGRTAEDVKAALAERRINVSVSERAATRLDMDRRGLDAVVRASVHYYNTESEVERLCAALAEPPMAAA